MLDTLLSFIAPHPCVSCGVIGGNLCAHCKNDIENEYYECCLVCSASESTEGICKSCPTPYTRAWCIGERSGILRHLIDKYKFYNNRAAYQDLASLLSTRIGVLPDHVTVVPVPTIPSHVRQRGYDHMRLIAKRVAKLQGVGWATPLQRTTSTVQRGSDRQTRHHQASRAFAVRGAISGGTYLLIDDVMTTGATLHYCAQALLEAGAGEVWVAAIARQPLD